MHSSFLPACSPVSARLLLACTGSSRRIYALLDARCLTRIFTLFSPPAPCTAENGLNPAGFKQIFASKSQRLSPHTPAARRPRAPVCSERQRPAALLRTAPRAATPTCYERAAPPSRRALVARQRAVGARLVACRIAWGRPRLAGVPSAPPAASRGWSRASRPATPAASPTASRRTRARCRS